MPDRDLPPKTRPGQFAGLNGRYLSALLRHRHMLLRSENAIARDAVQALREAREEIIARLLRLAARENAGEDISQVRYAQLRSLEEEYAALIARAEIQTTKVVREGLQKTSEAEAAFQARLLRRMVPAPIELSLTGVDIVRLAAIVNQPLGGVHWADRMRRNFGDLVPGMNRSLATSVALGEGMDSAARRLRKVVDTLGVQRSVLIVRSEIQRVANQTAQETYRQNADVIKGQQVVAALDGATCLVCASRDGMVLPLDAPESDLPIYHPGCRCFTSPVTKSWRELGIDRDEFTPGTRASMDGQVAGPITYAEWFERQSEPFQREVLGPVRYARYKAGDLKLKDMVKDLRTLNVDELPDTSFGLSEGLAA